MSFIRPAALLLLAFCCVAPALHAGDIFDGRTLTGWEGNRQVWRVEDGAITGEIPAGETLKRNEFIYFKEPVHDFELTLEFRLSGDPSANSGILFRAQRHQDGSASGYQADLDQGATWLGRIYDEEGRALLVERGTRVSIAPDGRKWIDPFAAPQDFAQLTLGDRWNQYRIIATGPHAEVWVNGKPCAVLDDHQTGEAEYSGHLAFQLHSGAGPAKIQFRNIQLVQLGKTDFPAADPVPVTKENRQTQSAALWHLRPNPAQPASNEHSPAASVVAGMLLTSGFQAELIAAEPDIHQPIAFTIDERGRLWVVEAFSYPNKQPQGQGKDRIRILEDADGDGTFETIKTFTEGLNLVSGIEVGFGGVWVGAAPQLLFIPDRDHDDQPDTDPEVLLDGFGFQDTHETLNSFVWGPDGWLYGNQGVFNTALIGKPGAADDQRVELRAGVWRYHPLRHTFEVFAHGGSNQWGLAFNDVGHLFMTHCRSYWGGGGTTYVIPGGHFWNQTNANYPGYVANFAPPGLPHLQNFLPASAKYDSGEGGAGKPGTDLVYGGHSHVGTMIYLGDNWPGSYRDHLFTHNLHGHQLNHQHNVREGSAYETLHAGYDLLYAPDPSYVAVDLDYGPCGGVYVIDWTDRQHCHNPRGEIWDRTNGRIYRITWADSYQPVAVNLRELSDQQLVELQQHRNRWYARTARRLLQERAANGKIDEHTIGRLHQQLGSDRTEYDVLCALWTLHVTGQLGVKDVQTAFKHASDIVRSWAVRLSTDSSDQPVSSNDTLLALATEDPSPTVRLALASALPRLDSQLRWDVGAALAGHGQDVADRFLPKMIWFGLAPLIATDADVPRALAIAESTPLLSLADSIYWYVARLPAGRAALAHRIAQSTERQTGEKLLRLLHFSLQFDSRLPMPESWASAAKRFRQDADLRRLTDELSAVFGDQRVLQRMRETLADRQADFNLRRQALEVLKRVGDTAANSIYVQLLDDQRLRGDVIPLVSGTGDTTAAAKLIELFPMLDEREKLAALSVLTSRREFALELLAAVDNERFDRKQLTALQIRQMHNLGSADISLRLEKIWGPLNTSPAEAQELIARLRETYNTAPLWAFSVERGGETFRKTCAVCHPLDGSSVPLGPSLAGSWRNGLDYFLENVVDPNAVVGESYRTTVVTTTSGLVVSGLLDSETDAAIVLRTAERTVTIPKDEIEERQLVSQSIMPTGLLNEMSEIEIIELLKFLMTEK